MRVEVVYLEKIVSEYPGVPSIELLKELCERFANVPDALFRLADRAAGIAMVSLNRAAYIEITITALERALQIWTIDRSPEEYCMTQNSIGNAHTTLAQAEGKKANCGRARDVYNRALEVFLKLNRFCGD